MANDVNINVVAQVQGAIQPLQQVQNQVQRVGGAIDRSTAAVHRNSIAYSRNGRSLARWSKGALQQAGYQVGDFAVQVANGTSGIQAFGQQGSQLLGIFGPIGAILGAGVAIFSAFALVVERSGGGFERYLEAFSGVGAAFGDFTHKLGILLQHFSVLSNMVGNVLTNAYSLLGGVIDFATQQMDNLIIAAGIFVTIQLAHIIYTTAMRFVGFIRAVVAAETVMRAFNLVVRRSPLTLLAVALGIAANEMGLLSAAMTELRQQFPEFFQDAEDAAEGFMGFIDSLKTAFNDLLDIPFRVQIDDNVDDVLSGVQTMADIIENRVKALEQSISRSMEDAFMSITDGTKTAKDAFKDMARAIISELYRVLVVQQTVARITSMLGMGGGKTTDLFKKILTPRAQGGAVSARGPYMVGERGPEMFIPSTSGRIVPNNQLGGGGGQVIVNQTINVSTGVQQTVRTEIKQLMPQIAESAKNAVVDAKRRGGSYGRAFA